MRTVPVQIVCRNCAEPYRTTVRGGNTRCPHCRTSRHVRVNQEWEGPVSADLSGAASRALQAAARPPVWVECGCGHSWQSRAKDRMTIRCPECGTGQRVPWRTDANTGPVPEGHRPPPPPPRPARARPAPMARPAPAWEPDDDPDDPDDPGEVWEPDPRPWASLASWMRNGGLAATLGPPTPRAPSPVAAALGSRPSRPAAARPAPAPQPPARATARPAGAAVQPIDPQQLPEREQRRRDDVCQMVRSLSASLLVWYNSPPGACEALDTNQTSDRQRCPVPAAFAVRFRRDVTEADAFTCPEHTRPLAALADRSPYITATVYRMR